MTLETGKHWSVLLKSALISMNSTKKKSYGYTPIKVMWGRESGYEDLLFAMNNIIANPDEDIALEEKIYAEFQSSTENMEIDRLGDEFLLPAQQPLEEISLFDAHRLNVNETAADSIMSEQLKQKRQYDKKVNATR